MGCACDFCGVSREKIFRFFEGRPDLQTPVEIGKDAHRELTYKQLIALVRECGVHPMQLLVNDPARYFTVMEAVGFIDISLGIKMGVQFRYFVPKALLFATVDTLVSGELQQL